MDIHTALFLVLDQKPLTLNLVTIFCILYICKLSERAGQENIWLEDIMYREGTVRSLCHEWVLSFCCVRTRNSQFIEKHVLVSHFCALLSLICNKSEQCFSFFATKPYKQVHYGWTDCCRPAHVNLSTIHMSAFTMVFYRIAQAEPVIWWNTSFAPFHSQDLIVNSPFWPPHIISL